MATVRRMPARMVPIAAPASPASPSRPATVGGPRLTARPDVEKMSGEQLIAQAAGYEASSSSNSYALGLCLRELSQEKRYRTELGFETFKALLAARKVTSRMTAFKLIQVVSTFSEEEVTKLGGSAKGYALIRLAKRQKGNTDARQFLSPKARIAGLTVSAASVRDINRLSSATGTTEHSKTAQRTSTSLGAALGRLGVAHRMRLHWHPDECVSVHLDPASARQLLGVLKSYRRLEKQGKRSGKDVFT